MGTAEGLASLFTDLLSEASWADCVHILRALLRLLPDVSRDLRDRLQDVLVGLLNLDQPPSLEVRRWPRPPGRPRASRRPLPTLCSAVLRTPRRSGS